jgi:hypothetical protein
MENLKYNPCERGFLLATFFAAAHDSAREIFGNNYYSETKDIRDTLHKIVADKNCSFFEAGIAMLKLMQSQGEFTGTDKICVQAVTYELQSEAVQEQAEDELSLTAGG